MGQITLLIVMGADADLNHTRNVVRWLEPEWFQVLVIGAPDDAEWDTGGPSPALLKVSATTGKKGSPVALRAAIASADVVDYHGFEAMREGFRARALDRRSIYTRTGVPKTMSQRQQEVWFMTQVGMAVAAYPSVAKLGGRRQEPLTRVDLTGSSVDRLQAVPTREEARRLLGLDGQALVFGVWAPGASVEPGVLGEIHEVAGAAGATVLTYTEPQWDAADARWSTIAGAADIVCLPVTDVPCERALPTAMASGSAVVVSRVVGFIGRVRCPVEGLMLPVSDVAAWRETLELLANDRAFREDLAKGAHDWASLEGPQGQVRILQGIYAGVLAQATGRCPTCPPDINAAFGR